MSRSYARAVTDRDPGDQREAKAQPATRRGREGAKRFVALVGRDPGSSVVDFDRDLRTATFDLHADHPTTVDPRILHEVRDRTSHERGIDRSADIAFGGNRFGRDARGGRDIGRELAEIDFAALERAELEPRRSEQPPDQIIEQEDFALELVERFHVAGIARGLDQHAHVAERRAQLVRDRREQLALIRELRLDLGRHVVERLREQPHLAAVIERIDLRVELAVSDIGRGFDREHHRPGQPERDRPRDRRDHEQRQRVIVPVRERPQVMPDRDSAHEHHGEPGEHPAPHPGHQPPRHPATSIGGARPHLALGLDLSPPARMLAVVALDVAHPLIVVLAMLRVVLGLAGREREHLAVAGLDRADHAQARARRIDRRRGLAMLHHVARDADHLELDRHRLGHDELEVAELDRAMNRREPGPELRLAKIELAVAHEHADIELLRHRPHAVALDVAELDANLVALGEPWIFAVGMTHEGSSADRASV